MSAFLFHQLYPLPYSHDIPDFCYYPLSLLTSEFAAFQSSLWASLVAQWKQIHLPMQKMWVQPLAGKIPWSRKWQPTPVFLPGKSHPLSMGSQRVITTEHTHTHLRSQAQEGSSHSRVPHTCWPLAWSSLNLPAQEQLLKLLLSCLSCIVPRISLPASHTLGILLIGL